MSKETPFQRWSRFLKISLNYKESINGKRRYCLWITDTNHGQAMLVPEITGDQKPYGSQRLESRRSATRISWLAVLLGEIGYKPTHSIIVPGVSSEHSKYIPMGFLKFNCTIVSNLASAIYDAEPWLFALLETCTWFGSKSICGYLGTSIRYSSTFGYNTFPSSTSY